ncbi:MAG: DNA polymerase III subunit delta, partial [Candidatus Zixiibacteriota bacterium]
FKPVYYFYGSEDYRRSEAEKFVAEHFLPAAQRSINYNRLDARNTSAAELAAALSNLPMLGEKEVYVVGSFESFKAKELEQLLPYIKSKDTNRVIILSSPSAKTPRKDSSFLKTVADFAELVEFRKLTASETQSSIKNRLVKHNILINDDALELLSGLVDGDKGGLESELNKLTDYKSEGEIVTVEDIRRISAGHEIFNIFDLGDVVIEARTQKILRMLNSLLGAGTSVDFLIFLLQQHFISLYLVKNGKSPVGKRGFLIYKFREQARNFSNQRLEQIILDLAQANTDLRYQNVPQTLVLETLTLKLSKQN